MFQITPRLRRYFVVIVLSVSLAVVTSWAQSTSDKWWTGYGHGPDNSRYFASRQINKSNVNQLQVAWTYPHATPAAIPSSSGA